MSNIEIFITEDINKYGSTRLQYFPANNQLFASTIQFRKHFKEALEHLKNRAFVFLHESNSEARLWVDDGQGNKHELIALVTLEVCKNGGRVVLFSGGKGETDMQDLRILLEDQGFHNGWHFCEATPEQIVKDHPIFLAQSFPSDWHVDETVFSGPDVALRALLGLSYFLELGSQETERATTDLKDRSASGMVNPEAIKKQFAPCLGDARRYSYAALARVCPPLSEAHSLHELWEVLRCVCDIQSLDATSQTHQLNQHEWGKLIVAAHNELRDLKVTLSNCHEFDQLRRRVSHDLFENLFLARLGEGGERMKRYWEQPSDITVQTSVERAVAKWKQEIKEKFENLLNYEFYHLKLSALGEEEKRKAKDAVGVLNSLLDSYVGLAKPENADKRVTWTTDFTAAVKTLRNILKLMATVAHHVSGADAYLDDAKTSFGRPEQ
jgi:hypothetical protein